MKAIIFDLDGTLIDSRADITAALNHSRQHFSLPEHDLEDVIPMIGKGLPHLIEMGFKDAPQHIEAAIDISTHYYQSCPSKKTIIFSGVVETLKKISDHGIPMAIISNKPSALIGPVLDSLHLSSFFDAAIGGEDYPERKPSPLAAMDLCKKWNLDPHEVAMVGDMSPDMEMAKAAHMPFIFCNYGYSAEKLQAQSYLDEFSDLLSVLSI
jgi:phosphoglycolate phosphatase